ncbi:MAG: hypothetical protein OES32_03360 [Acidobacteriota bacterium]|nr:hypothetical protein [Acidobacteriota bacterium]MDH3522601.1 hypothetical protein [Acidobacteriota bacterium]
MARDIAEGHVLVTERTFTRLKNQEIDRLRFELARLLTSLRGKPPAIDATQEIQLRQRRMQRLTSAQRMLESFLDSTRRRA